jgi:hypothetical protein
MTTITVSPAIAQIKRGCGYRVMGAVYIVSDAKQYPKPLRDYLVDSPVTLAQMGLRKQSLGVQMIVDKLGVYHIVDSVGLAHYPTPIHFYHEVEHHGASRKVAVDAIDWGKLTTQSRLLVAHDHAYIANHSEYYDAMGFTGKSAPLDWSCVKNKPEHENKKPREMCVNLLWADTDPAEDHAYIGERWGLLAIERSIANGEVFSTCERPSIVTPSYKSAVYMSLPITHIHIIHDPFANKHVSAFAKTRRSVIPVKIMPF